MSRHICVIGGTGFIGSHLVFMLANQGHQVLVPTRRRERHRQFLVHSNVRLVETNVYDKDALQPLIEKTDCVINLVGILNETGGATFQTAHVELVKTILAAMQSGGVSRLLHMSALNADASNKQCDYLRSKGEAENLLMAANSIQTTIFRPSVVFGPGDSFFNRFATLLRITPLVFPLACPNARFSPVYVGNVVDAFSYALDHADSAGQRYELCGPQTFKLRELVEYTATQMGIRRTVIGLPGFLSRLQAIVLGLMPGKPFSLDNYYALQIDSICTQSAFADIGITPHSIQAVVPGYLAGHNPNARYQLYRQHARR